MTSGSRAPTSKERENNKRRERKRRAIAARIFAGLRQYGNYKLPKHCDNNEVLKALCREAGWIVDDDGTTYKPGCKPVQDLGDCCISSSASPASSSFAQGAGPGDGLSLIPWLKGLSASCMAVPATPRGAGNAGSGSISSRNPSLPPLQIMRGGTCSAPVTPPLSSPRTAFHVQPDWTELSIKAGDVVFSDCAATALSNAFHSCIPIIASTAASGTSTPTYPPVYIMSGASTPSHFIASGSATPFLPSGASTPTYASSMRGMPSFNFAAVAAMAAVQQQQAAQDRDQMLPNAAPPEPDRLQHAGKASINMDMAMDGRQGVFRQSGRGLKSDDEGMELGKDLPATNVDRLDPAGNGDSSGLADGRSNARAPRVAGANMDIFGGWGDHHAVDRSLVCNWSQNQLDGRMIHAMMPTAAAIPDATSIVPENYRRVPDADQGHFTFRTKKNRPLSGIVKPWEGETIHEVSLEEEGLQLTLGNASTMAAASPTAVDICSRPAATAMLID